jgi:putative tryptophan/tyrosine transport system permease protein
MAIDLILTGLLQGLILALLAYGIMIPFRLLNLPDLTAEGAYPFAGALCASSLLIGLHPMLATLLSTILAGLMGVATGLIYLRLKINSLLAGIILSTMVYSINLRIIGKPNVALFDSVILFTHNNILTNILIILAITAVLILLLTLFLHTEIGLRLRAVGANPEFAERQGIAVAKYTMLGMFLASCFTGLGGSIMVQLQSYMDINMGVGIVIHALAALMIGESIVGNNSLTRQLFAPLAGALIYQQIQGIALSLGLAPSDLKFFTGAIVLAVVAVRKKQHAA